MTATDQGRSEKRVLRPILTLGADLGSFFFHLYRSIRCRAGFTVVDMVLVVIIIAIFSMIAIPGFHSMIEESRLNAAAREMVSAINYTVALAVRHQRPFGFEANAANNTYQVYDQRYKTDSSPHLDADPPVTANGIVQDPVKKTWLQIDLDISDSYSGVSITAVPSGNNVVFYPDGHSGDSNVQWELTYGNRLVTLFLDSTTGRLQTQ
jgi:Tfp pilus assembly protein FimT